MTVRPPFPSIEAAIKRADDKERLVGLLAASVAAAIGLLVMASLVAHDPTALLQGRPSMPSLYLELGAVTMALALVMLVTAWFRKRTFLGIAMALYGLSVFNLHYWGFGLPFILAGAWFWSAPTGCRRSSSTPRADGPVLARPRPGSLPPAVQAVRPADGSRPATTQAQAGQGARGRLSRGPALGRARVGPCVPLTPPSGVAVAPRSGVPTVYQGRRISSQVGNTDVTVLKSPHCIVGASGLTFRAAIEVGPLPNLPFFDGFGPGGIRNFRTLDLLLALAVLLLFHDHGGLGRSGPWPRRRRRRSGSGRGLAAGRSAAAG